MLGKCVHNLLVKWTWTVTEFVIGLMRLRLEFLVKESCENVPMFWKKWETRIVLRIYSKSIITENKSFIYSSYTSHNTYNALAVVSIIRQLCYFLHCASDVELTRNVYSLSNLTKEKQWYWWIMVLFTSCQT